MNKYSPDDGTTHLSNLRVSDMFKTCLRKMNIDRLDKSEIYPRTMNIDTPDKSETCLRRWSFEINLKKECLFYKSRLVIILTLFMTCLQLTGVECRSLPNTPTCGRDKYFDPITNNCGFCWDICAPSRATPEDCQRHKTECDETMQRHEHDHQLSSTILAASSSTTMMTPSQLRTPWILIMSTVLGSALVLTLLLCVFSVWRRRSCPGLSLCRRDPQRAVERNYDARNFFLPSPSSSNTCCPSCTSSTSRCIPYTCSYCFCCRRSERKSIQVSSSSAAGTDVDEPVVHLIGGHVVTTLPTTLPLLYSIPSHQMN